MVGAILWGGVSVPLAHAQTVNKNTIKSSTDDLLVIKSVVLIPVRDNQNSVYARPATDLLREFLQADSQWSLAAEDSPSEFTSSDLKSLMTKAQSQAALSALITRGPRGFQVELTLYLADGRAFLKAEKRDIQNFEVSELKKTLSDLYLQVRRSIPYHGLLQSRAGQDVKINIGADFGVKVGDSVSVIQFIGLRRHPKLDFLVGTERESIGKIAITKVESHSAFGQITFERDAQLVQPGMKVWAETYLAYPAPLIGTTQVAEQVTQQDSKHVFGESPIEWLPSEAPQYGRLSLISGISMYSQNLTLNTAGGLTASKPLVFNLRLEGEAWIDSNWFLMGRVRQNAWTVDNPLPGSGPSSLQMTFSQYVLGGGYHFLMSNDFWGPKFQLRLASANTKFDSDTSSPTALTSMTFSGTLLGLAVMGPVSTRYPLTLGINFDYYLMTNISENIASGGNAKANITVVDFFGTYRWTQNFALRGEFGLEQYSASFSGAGERSDPASSISHKLTNFLIGFDYLF